MPMNAQYEDVVPLVPNSGEDESTTSDSAAALRKRRQRNLSRQRLQSLELYLKREEEENASFQTTCFGDSWRFLASVLLASIIVGPLLLTHYRSSASSHSTTEWLSSFDSLPCAHSLQISYSTVYDKIAKATSFCQESQPLCSCTSPLVPKAAVDDSQIPQWNEAFQRNVDLVKNISATVDVVLLGDSITEHWQGTSMGREKYPEINKVYMDLFQNKRTTGVTGLALGISGDRCPQVMYRLRNGEFLSHTKVWWLLIGTNDLVTGGCTAEAILIGILEIVHEIRTRDEEATVVLNSILPRSLSQTGNIHDGDSVWNDICWINKRLECLAEGSERIDFFNATSIFLKNDQFLNETRMPDMLHPSAEGSRVWGTEIVNHVTELVST